MKLINQKNGQILANRIKIANNPFTRAFGLLGKSNLNKGEGLHIIPCNGIHSFFMQFKFDAVFLNKNNEVVHLIRNMPEWRASKIYFSAHSVAELPAGVIDETATTLGDVLEFM
jgi:uncharacterized membrane protein (UPF0127 family)